MGFRQIAGAALTALLCAPGFGTAEEGAPAAREVLFGFTVVPFGAEGIETVSSVARRFRLDGYGAAEIAGHADTVGEEDVNVALAQRRAEYARDELIAFGVPASAIALRAYGETRLAEETGDEVRRAANRRVEIAIMGVGLRPPLDETRPPPMKLPPPPALRD